MAEPGKRILFLDFDGVLNSEHWFRHGKQDTKCDSAARAIDPAAVGLLNVIVDRSGADVVVSSTWRMGGLHHVRACLAERGFFGRVIGITPVFAHGGTGEVVLIEKELPQVPVVERLIVPGTMRGNEIQAWIDMAPAHRKPERIVILDDDSDMAHLAPYLVKTSFHRGGLQPEHVDKALAVLDRRFAAPEAAE